jgi:Domain of unknown function (DUF4124)
MRIAVSKTTIRLLSGVGVLLGALVGVEARADGGALYRWVTADGTVSYTDDAKRVPERYRESAQTIERSMLTDYGRYTATDSAAHEEQTARLEKRLDALRTMNGGAHDASADASNGDAPVMTGTAPATHDIHRRRLFTRPDGTQFYRYYTNQTTTAGSGASLPVDPNDPNPVVTEQQRVRVPGEPLTQSVTVTRQGDRVLSIVKPRSHYHRLEFPVLGGSGTE